MERKIENSFLLLNFNKRQIELNFKINTHNSFNYLEKIDNILLGCRKADSRCQKLLYEHYYGFAMKIVFRYIYNYEEAKEITNDGFVKFFLNIDKFITETRDPIEKKLGGWIKKIMVNTAIDLLRKKMMLPEIGGIPESAWDIKESSPSVEQLIIYKELVMLIKKLQPEYRIVFNMHVIDGYKHIEIAEILGIPVGTSKSNLMKAKGLMQKFINQKESLAACRI
ncbi:MAG: sigma-70 family RNA polymerase sigma factor [Ginsengibacter sp.]